ncbi:Polypeptide deformylase [Actinopolyspora mzabensis]|uniref:Peptide deformylase n=1 Tax=Actinopolyspora mzabensis TaxID=995066 RepID=A0A1G8ZLC1_ACTMZ|nr:peptide deformylase [Actinopolyspora mzabensis]SDK15866.1 Polypeptide deformylase [Actinopolyspora mzabensis]
MSVRPIRLLGDPVLRGGSAEVGDFDSGLRALVRDLWDTMESHGGAGLAAPQLGEPVRVFAYHCAGHAGHLVNPSLRPLDEQPYEGPEGCLSVPEVDRLCPRYRTVLVRGWNMHGEPVEVVGSDLLARCLQHETDHLDGVVFLDRLDERSAGPPHPEPAQPEPAQPEPAHPEQAHPEQARSRATQHDPAQPNPAQQDRGDRSFDRVRPVTEQDPYSSFGGSH